MIGRAVLAIVIGLVLACPGLFAAAQEPRAPAAPPELRFSYAPLVDRIAPAVVNVYASKTVEARNLLFDDPFFRRFFGPREGETHEQIQRSLGSGVIVDAGGLIVTTYHIIEGATEVRVATADRREFETEIVLRDMRTDLAILRIKNSPGRFPAIEFGDSDKLRVGDIVIAVGNPFGIGQTVTHGIVSALARSPAGISDYQFFIQTDAAINPGNSGGALVDLSGRLTGINSAIVSRSGGSQGIGFAIPVNMVRFVVATAQSGATRVRRPWLGAKLQPVPPKPVDGALRRPAGALVAEVKPASPAARAGLKVGDVIVSLEGQKVDDPSAFEYRLAIKTLNGQAQLGILRNGIALRLSVALEPAPELPAREAVRLSSVTPFQGATVANLSPALAEELGLDLETEGVVVFEVEAGTRAEQLGLQKGDIIRSINEIKIERTIDLDRILQTSQPTWRLELERSGRILITTV
jgi:Do/DeqQ family serine protease